MELEAWWYPVLFATGLAAGFVDAIAGGGGLITVPVLLATGLPAPVALATNKLQSTCGTSLATWNYARAGLLPWRRLAPGVAITFVAAVAGTACVRHLDPDLLRRLIPFLLLAVAGYTAVRPGLGLQPGRPRLRPGTFALAAGLPLGFYDGFLGPGTGSFWMLACVVGLGLDLRAATGHTKAMNLASNVASLGAFLVAGQVAWAAGLAMAAGQLIGAHAGSRTALRAGARVIRPVFLGVVTVLSLKLLSDAFLPRPAAAPPAASRPGAQAPR